MESTFFEIRDYILFPIKALGGWIYAHPFWSIFIVLSLFFIFLIYEMCISLYHFLFPYKYPDSDCWTVSKTEMILPDGKTYQQIFAPFRPSSLIDDNMYLHFGFVDEADFIDDCFQKSIEQGNYWFSEDDFESKKTSLRINRVGGMIMMYQKTLELSKLSRSEKKKKRREDADCVELSCTPLIICGGHIDPTTFKFKLEFITYSSRFASMIKKNTRLENTWVEIVDKMFIVLAYAHRFNLTKEEKNLKVAKEEMLRTSPIRNLKGTSLLGRTASSLYFIKD